MLQNFKAEPRSSVHDNMIASALSSEQLCACGSEAADRTWPHLKQKSRCSRLRSSAACSAAALRADWAAVGQLRVVWPATELAQQACTASEL